MALDPNNIIILLQNLLELIPLEKRETALNLIENALVGSDEASVEEFTEIYAKFKELVKH